MISRRLVRIKAMQTYYAFLQDSGDVSAERIWQELKFNIEKSHELYIYLHCLLLAVCDFAEDRIELNRKKHLPSSEDLNPNTKFINNRILTAFRNNTIINKQYSNNNFNWSDYSEFIKSIWMQITVSDYYNNYILSENNSLKEDIKIIDKIISKTLTNNVELDDILEEKSIYWNDDIEYVISMISKTIKSFTFNAGPNQPLMPLFKDIDDKNFAKELLRKSVINHEELRGMIKEHSRNWDLERIAFMDILIMQLAISEFLYFPSIPTKVSLNEYIEISKYYSTDKSRNFINGILDKTLKDLKTKGLIQKAGRGLVGEA